MISNDNTAFAVPRLKEGFAPTACDVFDFHLQATSPCTDRGRGSEETVVHTETDLEGNERTDADSAPNNGVGSPKYVDMGAYEFF